VFPDIFGFPTSPICVIDTSVMIEFKRLVKITEQWDLLQFMSELVVKGSTKNAAAWIGTPRIAAAEVAPFVDQASPSRHKSGPQIAGRRF
jgi:hypothetical protein